MLLRISHRLEVSQKRNSGVSGMKWERVVTAADFSGHVGERNRSDDEVLGRYDGKERHAEGQMVVGFFEKHENGCGEHISRRERI